MTHHRRGQGDKEYIKLFIYWRKNKKKLLFLALFSSINATEGNLVKKAEIKDAVTTFQKKKQNILIKTNTENMISFSFHHNHLSRGLNLQASTHTCTVLCWNWNCVTVCESAVCWVSNSFLTLANPPGREQTADSSVT